MKQDTKIIVVVVSEEKPQPPKKPQIDPSLLKAFSITVITLVSWLNPEAIFLILTVRLLLILLEWLNNQHKG